MDNYHDYIVEGYHHKTRTANKREAKRFAKKHGISNFKTVGRVNGRLYQYSSLVTRKEALEDIKKSDAVSLKD